MKDFLFLIKREFRMFFRTRVAMLVFIGAPLFFGLIIGMVYQKGAPSELPIVVVDYDNTQLSRKAIDALDDNENISVSQVCQDNYQARELFESGKIEAIVAIPSRFMADIQQKRYPEVQVDINTSNILTANYITRGVQSSLLTINAGIEIEGLMKKGMPANVAATQFESFKLNIDKHFNLSGNYLQFMLPGVLCAIFQQVLLLVIALVFSQEFEKRTFSTLLKHSHSSLVLILVKTIPYLIMGSVLWYAIIYGMLPYFRIPITGNAFDIFVLSEVFILSMISFGIMVSILFPKQLAATEVLMIIASPSFIISGFTWPLEQMPLLVQMFASCIPLTHFANAFRKLAYMNTSLNNVAYEINAMLIITVASMLVAWIMLHFKIIAWQHDKKLVHALIRPGSLKKIKQ